MLYYFGNRNYINFKQMQKRNQKGFTLIELLIVVAIIGLLATLAIVSLNTARQKANDTKRVADLKSMQTALELYWNGEGGGAYPDLDVSGTSEDWTDFETDLSTYLPALPTDPTSGGEYHYYFTAGGTEYVLMSTLQDPNATALDVDIEPRNGGNVYGRVVGANGTATTADSDPSSGTNPTCDEGSSEYCLLSVEA